MKRILILSPYPEGIAAGQRLKYEIHLNTFKNNGYSIEISSFIDLKTWNYIFKKGFLINKILSTIHRFIPRSLTTKLMRKIQEKNRNS